MEITYKINRKIRSFLKRCSNRHITLFFFYRRTLEYLQKDDIRGISPGISYYLIMGFIPFLIFIVNVILFFSAADIDAVFNAIHQYSPNLMAKTVAKDVEGIVERIVEQRSDLWLWISLLASGYSFEKALALLIRATDEVDYNPHVKDNKPLKAKRFTFLIHLKSILFSMGLVIAIIISLGLSSFGQAIVKWIEQSLALPQIFLSTWNIIVYAIPFIVIILYLTIFYCAAPKSYTPPLKHAVVTAFFVTVFWLLSTTVYSWILLLIPTIGASYGPLFGLFIMFGWFYYIVFIIIVGICFIKSWRDFRHKLEICGRKLNSQKHSL